MRWITQYEDGQVVNVTVMKRTVDRVQNSDDRTDDGKRDAADGATWSTLVSRSVMPFRISLPGRGSFHGAIDHAPLADLDLFRMDSERHTASRDSRLVHDDGQHRLIVTIQLAGELHLSQAGRSTTIRPGSFTLYSSDAPVEIESSDGYRALCLRIPVARLANPSQDWSQVAATRLDAEHGLAPAVWGFVLNLSTIRIAGPSAGAVGHHAVALVDQMLREQIEPVRSPQATPAEAQRERCRAFIEENLSDVDLSPSKIAEATFISTRYLHQLFSDTGTTVAAYVRQRRLDRVVESLSDPMRRNQSVERIVRDWGVTNVSYFGQVFKRTMDLTPAQFRQQALAERADVAGR